MFGKTTEDFLGLKTIYFARNETQKTRHLWLNQSANKSIKEWVKMVMLWKHICFLTISCRIVTFPSTGISEFFLNCGDGSLLSKG